MILVDTREKKNEHILRHLSAHNIPYSVIKLSVGDYMDSEKPHLTIDRKQDLQELAGNICTADGRFWREVRRGKQEGLKLIVLIEQGGMFQTMNDVPKWSSKYTKVTGRMLFERMFHLHVAYGVEFLFCDKRSTGKRILELLKDG